jgi:glycosyltransferase involved in cell wall biosynthesis
MSGEIEAYRGFVRDGGFDVVMNYAAQQWATDALLEVLPSIKARKVLVPCGFSGLYEPDFAEFFRRMPGWMRGYDASVYLAERYRDIDFARQHGLQGLRLIPNGAGEDEFRDSGPGEIRARLGLPADAFVVLHVGSHTGVKGHAEAIAMFRRAGLRNAALVIVANSFGGGCARACARKAAFWSWWPPDRSAGRRILVRELSRADTVALYHAADCFLFPSNIECSPIVLFEAAASRTPFLASNAGNSAEIAAWTGAGEIIETRQDQVGLFWPSVADGARRLKALAGDAPRRRAMAEAGRAAWEARFTWDGIARQYEALYQELCAKA